jgi:hypothetical protein
MGLNFLCAHAKSFAEVNTNKERISSESPMSVACPLEKALFSVD